MTGKTHLTIGASIVATFVLLIEQDLALAAGPIAVGSIATLLPDVDAKNSLLQSKVFASGRTKIADAIVSRRERKGIIGSIIHLAISLVELLIRASIQLIFELIKTLTSHRGATHYLITLFLLTSLILIPSYLLGWSNIYAFSFFIGYLVHILLDSMTISGVRLFYPFYKKPIYLLPKHLRIRTGAFIEVWISAGVVLVCLVILYILGVVR